MSRTIKSAIQLCAGLCLLTGLPTLAGDVIKANNTDNLNLTTSWVGGVVPTNLDVAVWDSTVTSNTSVLLGADTSWQGIRVANVGGVATISTNSTVTTLTNGVAGIDMSGASTNLIINAPIVVSDTQTWNVASDRSLTIGGTIRASTNAPLTKSGGGALFTTGGLVGNLSNLVINGGSVSIGGTAAGESFQWSRVTFSNNATYNSTMGGNPSWQFSNVTVAADSIVNINYGARGFLGKAGAVLVFGTNVTFNLRVDTTIDRNMLSGDWRDFNGTINVVGNSPTARISLSPNNATLNFNTAALTNAVLNLSSSNPGVNFITVGGTMNSGGNTIAIGALIGTGGSFISPNANGAATWSIGALNSNTTFAGVINNGGAAASRVVKVGTGTLILSGTNTYSGATTISGGTLQIGDGGTTGTPGTGDITNNANLAFNRSNAYNFINNIVGSGSVVQAGSGTLTLGGANSYTGATVIIAGTLSVTGEVNLGTAPASPTASNIVINGGAFSAAASFTLNANRGIAVGPTAGSGSGTIDVASGQTLVYGGTVDNNGGTGSLIKTGTGGLELAGTSSYSGSATVNAGTLKVTGTLPGNVTVSTSAALSGNGTITGLVTVQSGGTISPGTSVGILTAGALTMNSGSVYNFEFNSSPANDNIVVTNSNGLTVNGGAFNLYIEGTALGWTTLGTYNLIQFTGSIQGTGLDSSWTTSSPGNPHIANPQSGLTYSFDTSGGWLRVTIAGGANIGFWSVDSDGNWSLAGNWTATAGTMPPRNPSDVASLGVGSALRTINLNANETVGGLSFTNANSFVITNTANTLTWDGSGAGAQVSVTDGTANDIRTAVSLNDKATVSVSSGKSLTVSGPISGTSTSKTLTVASAGTLILTGTNTYGPATGLVGTTLGGGGTLQLGNKSALGAGDLRVSSSATIKTLGSFTVSNNIATAVATTTVTIDDNGNNVALDGVVSGSGGWLTKIGSGTLTLDRLNTYFNNTTVSAGTLKLGVDDAIPSGGSTTGWLVLDGGDPVAGTLDLNGHNQTVNALSGLTSNVLGQIVNNSGGGTNMLTVSNGPAINTTFAGSIQDNNNATSGKVALTLAGAGTLNLSGANSYSGGTTVSNGTLRLGNNTALGSGTLTMSGGNLDSTVGNMSNNNLQNWNTNFTFVGTSSLDMGNGAVSLGATCQVTVSANVLTVRGAISGAFGLAKAGAGTLTLTGNNNYSGDTTAAGGNLLIDSGGVITGAAANVSAVGSAILEVRNGALFATSGNIGTPSIGLFVSGGSATYSGALSMAPGNAQNSLIHVGGSGILTVGSLSLGRTGNTSAAKPTAGSTTQGLYMDGGTVNIVGNLSMSDNATANSVVNTRIDNGYLNVGGALIVGLANTVRWSDLDVNGGILTVNDTTTGISLGSSQAGNAILLMHAGVATTPKISLGQAIGGTNHLAGTSAIEMSGGSLYIGSGGIVQVSTNIATSIVWGGGILGATNDWSSSVSMAVSGVTIQAADSGGTAHNINLSGALGGSSFTKEGAGVLTLSGTNTYDSGATVNNGILRVNGSVASAVNVNSGGTLGGVGTINGAVSIANGATLSPGALPGTLTINGDLGLNDTSTLAYELGTSSDLTVVNGNLTLDGVVNVTNAGGLANGNYTLIAYTGSLSDNTLNVGTLPSPFSGSVSNDLVNKLVVLVVTGGSPPDPFTTWQSQYFGCTGCAQAQGGADPDGDGMSNTNEFLAGFNPTNSAAYLHVISVARLSNDIKVTYLGANGDSSGSPGPKTNVLEFTTGTGNGSYTNNFASAGVTNVLTGGTGAGQMTNMVDSGGATNVPSRFYRVRVLAP